MLPVRAASRGVTDSRERKAVSHRMASPLGSPVGGLPAAESFTSQPDVSEVLGLRADSGATPVPTPPLSAAPRTSTSPLVLGAGAAPTSNDFVNTVQGTQGAVTEKDPAPTTQSGAQAGIGVVLTPAPPDFQELQVAKVFDGGAAAKSGLIFEGDVIHRCANFFSRPDECRCIRDVNVIPFERISRI